MVVVVWRWSWCVGNGGSAASAARQGTTMPDISSLACERTHCAPRHRLFKFQRSAAYLLQRDASRALGATSPAPLDGTAPPTRGKPEPYSSVSRSEPYSTSTGCAGVVTMFQNCHST